MLKVFLHAADLAKASPQNCVGWMDIGYEKLAPIADYKVLLFTVGLGAAELAYVRDYPRYSGSVFDLVARAIAVALQREEALPPAPLLPKCAYARSMAVVVNHIGTRGPRWTTQLATMQVRLTKRGRYDVQASEDIFGQRTARVQYAPERFTAWMLAAYAMCQCLAGTDALPPRPPVQLPKVVSTDDGTQQVLLQSLHEPAKSCLTRLLLNNGKRLDPDPLEPAYVTEGEYIDFLARAV